MAMDRIFLEQLDTTGATDGQAALYNAALDEMGFGPVVRGLVAGTGVTIDSTDPAHPIIASSGGGGTTWGRPFPVDIPPTVPNAKDDEFDGTSSASWSATPSAATSTLINPSNATSMLEILQSGSANFQGLVQAIPAYPFTITACLAYTDMLGANDRGGMLILGPASPTSASLAVTVGRAAQVNFAGVFNFAGTFQSVNGPQPTSLARIYMRIRANSASSIDSWLNENGSGWIPHHVAFNPGFTPGVMGLASSRGSGTLGSRAYFDWFRVT